MNKFENLITLSQNFAASLSSTFASMGSAFTLSGAAVPSGSETPTAKDIQAAQQFGKYHGTLTRLLHRLQLAHSDAAQCFADYNLQLAKGDQTRGPLTDEYEATIESLESCMLKFDSHGAAIALKVDLQLLVETRTKNTEKAALFASFTSVKVKFTNDAKKSVSCSIPPFPSFSDVIDHVKAQNKNMSVQLCIPGTDDPIAEQFEYELHAKEVVAAFTSTSAKVLHFDLKLSDIDHDSESESDTDGDSDGNDITDDEGDYGGEHLVNKEDEDVGAAGMACGSWTVLDQQKFGKMIRQGMWRNWSDIARKLGNKTRQQVRAFSRTDVGRSYQIRNNDFGNNPVLMDMNESLKMMIKKVGVQQVKGAVGKMMSGNKNSSRSSSFGRSSKR